MRALQDLNVIIEGSIRQFGIEQRVKVLENASANLVFTVQDVQSKSKRLEAYSQIGPFLIDVARSVKGKLEAPLSVSL
jgi:hypothetical protein